MGIISKLVDSAVDFAIEFAVDSVVDSAVDFAVDFAVDSAAKSTACINDLGEYARDYYGYECTVFANVSKGSHKFPDDDAQDDYYDRGEMFKNDMDAQKKVYSVSYDLVFKLLKWKIFYHSRTSILLSPRKVPQVPNVDICDELCIMRQSSDYRFKLWTRMCNTGKTKGVKLSHRNLISTIVGAFYGRKPRSSSSPAVHLSTVPYFHAYGFTLCLRMVAFGESLVSIAKFDLGVMARLIEFSVTHLAVAPPVVVALLDENNERLVNSVDWKSQSYGLTETTGEIARGASPCESMIPGTVGRLIANCEAKIVDPNTGVSLPTMNHGELLVRGYVDDKEVIATMVEEGWFKTGDICYFDNEGFLFVVDQLKELIKYKNYQMRLHGKCPWGLWLEEKVAPLMKHK
ncbi:AMP-dependent synthetase/ligase, AMP-binding enzyme C-terminal domain protein [Artemisia annua]|uniref:AMP-dependent synthetase/ligase, AMP-binding enzyme C-terminal domain protein n=1 Tax=Artemisia annua TaxID=35608 RepID=A0A2U1QB31_ARTAN|nr:AMP-dependent synthetase/ligase, AMP-binding enzyme C-terminal domain protein [Artemisia annua]